MPCRQPATLRAQMFVAGAVLGLVGKQIALKFSTAWGGLAKHRQASAPLDGGLDLANANSAEVGFSALNASQRLAPAARPGRNYPCFRVKLLSNFGVRV